MGLLDDLLSGQTGASPWGALYQTEDEATRRARAAGDVLASMGVSPTNLPQISPFDMPQPPAAAPVQQQPAFGAGATPFGFAGPGSMTGINPAMMATPAATAAPQVAQQPAPPATDVSSVNRPAPAPAGGDGPDSYVPVGNYSMPMFGEAPDVPARPAPAAPGPVAAPGGAPFSLAGNIGDRLSKATTGFLGNLGNGPVGALAGGIGALVTGRNTDPASILAEKSNATARALIAKGASVADVQAATNNPTLMAALVTEYYGKDKWSVVKTGQDGDGRETYMQQNQVDGTLRPIAGGPAAASGASDTVVGPDGKPITIPPGVNRKEFIKQVTHATADAATGKGTEAQNKASSFATRMTQAQSVLGSLEGEGKSLWGKAADGLPGGNYLQSPEYQKYKQAASAFITAMLRQESGAAINKSEFERYEKEMFPQPGDDPGVVSQKAAMRAAATEQMRRAAGPGFKPPASAPAASTARGSVNIGGQSVPWSVN